MTPFRFLSRFAALATLALAATAIAQAPTPAPAPTVSSGWSPKATR